MDDIDHLIDQLKKDDAFMQNGIITQLIAWRRHLMPEEAPPDEMEMETIRELARNIDILLTYPRHEYHPYFDRDDIFDILVHQRARQSDRIHAGLTPRSFEVDEVFVQDMIIPALIARQRHLLGDDFCEYEAWQDEARLELGRNIPQLLTYRQHRRHPYFDRDDGISIFIERLRRRTFKMLGYQE